MIPWRSLSILACLSCGVACGPKPAPASAAPETVETAPAPAPVLAPGECWSADDCEGDQLCAYSPGCEGAPGRCMESRCAGLPRAYEVCTCEGETTWVGSDCPPNFAHAAQNPC